MMELKELYYPTPIHILHIKYTEEGILSVQFSEESHHVSIPTNELEETILQQFNDYFEGRSFQFQLPLAPSGTAFQQSVWNQLIKIPYGKTISYKELSVRLGDPKTIRAAAAANGQNPIMILIPCHRVIGSKGDLVGYAGQLWRKQWLLEHENKFANGVQTLF